jgi:hypothetical protein
MQSTFTPRSHRIHAVTANESAIGAFRVWSFGWWYYTKPEGATALV